MLKHEGFLVHALAFERDYHSGRIPECSIVRLGIIKNQNYLYRLLIFFKAFRKIRKEARKSNYIYAFGTDLGFLAYFACLGLNKPIAVEIGDLRWLQCSQGLIGKIFRKIECYFANRYKLIVVISACFLEKYYREWLGVQTSGLIIENKIFKKDFEIFDILPKNDIGSGKPLVDRPLKIGYFGLLRDEWSYKVLTTLARQFENKFQIVFAGYPVNPKDLAELIRVEKSLCYLGEYKSPDDLPFLYNQIDMSWACYPEIKNDDFNFKWGRPNRFYEGCYFKKPFFCRRGSLFSHDVDKFGIGYSVIETKVELVVEKLSRISYQDFQLWSQSMLSLPEYVYMYQNEGEELADKLNNLNEKNLTL